LVTKDHFSSSWTSWVVGGKSHEFVVGLLGVGAGPQGVADDGVFINARQACGLADAAAVLEVLKDGEGPFVGESAAEEGTAFAFGETCLAGAADEHAALFGWAVAKANAEIGAAAQAVIRTVRVLAAEEAEVVHEKRSSTTGRPVDKICEVLYNYLQRPATLGGHHRVVVGDESPDPRELFARLGLRTSNDFPHRNDSKKPTGRVLAVSTVRP
jgi:hypothetical protein